MHRRQLLTGFGAAVGISVVGTACGSDSGGVPDPGDQGTLFVQAASLEFLAGPDRWLAFGIRDQQNTPLEDADVEVWVRRIATSPEETAEVVAGPIPAEYSPAVDTGQGVYYLQASIEDPGLYDVIAMTGDTHGVASIQVVDSANSRVAVPGQEAISAPTATVENDLGVFDLCTQEPACSMHEMSLDEALGTGRPVALLFATPQFCQTAVCGPAVATLEEVRSGEDWRDTIFIHTEIFAEEPAGGQVAATPLVEAVEAWGLPSEPWFFTIGGDGVIEGRLDGPMPQEILTSLLEDLTA